MLAFWMGGASSTPAAPVADGLIDYEFTVQITRSEQWAAGLAMSESFTVEINRAEEWPGPLS